MTTITLRGVKGSPLTNGEVDDNFNNLNSYKVEQTSATGAANLPAGTTAQRPASPAAGQIRYNASTGKFEGYGSAWGNIGGGAATADTPPSNPSNGDLWWNSSDGRLYVYFGAWVQASGGGEGQYLPLTGGTISGNLAYTGTLTGGTGIINIGSGQIYKDASGNLGLGVTPSAWRTDVSFKALQMPGGSFTAYMAGGLDQTPGVVANGYVDSGGTWRYINSRAASWYIQNGGMHAWYTAPSGTAGNAISFTQSLAFNKGTSLALEGASSVTGTGISFPATQNASSDANTLDDYEEGTWSPVYLGNGGANNPTSAYNFQNGTYVKIGKFVMLSFELSTNSVSGGSGQLQIGGFPFVAANTRYQGGLTIGYSTGWSSSGFAPRQGYVYTGWTMAYLTYLSANYNQTEVQTSSLATTGGNYVIGHVVYMTS